MTGSAGSTAISLPLFIQTSAIHSGTFRAKSSSTHCRGEVDSKLVFEDGGEIDKNTKQNKSINYEKNFTFNSNECTTNVAE